MIRRAVNLLAVPVTAIAIWWFASAGSTDFYFPPLQVILEAFVSRWGAEGFMHDVVPSVSRLLVGYLIAVVAGISLGTLIGLFRPARDLLAWVLEFFRAVPSPVTVPILILFFGIGDVMKIVVIISACVWPILLNTERGVRSTDEVLGETSQVFGVTGIARIRHYVLPAASPFIFAGLRQGLSFAVVVMVISELFAATNGIGFAVIQAQRTFDIPKMWAGVILIGLLGIVLATLFRVVERRVLRWYRGARQAERSA